MRPVRFEILKETWNTWELADEIVLRVRPHLVWVIGDGDSAGTGQVRTALGIGAIVPKALHGDPTPGGTGLADRTPVKEYGPTEWKAVETGRSIYLLETGSMINLRAILRKVERYPVFDQNREPIVRALAVTELLVQGPDQPEAVPAPDLLKNWSGTGPRQDTSP